MMLACIISDTLGRHTRFRRLASEVSVYLTIGGAKSDGSTYSAKSSTTSALKTTTSMFTVARRSLALLRKHASNIALITDSA